LHFKLETAEGLLRINVLGKRSHILLKKRHELAWTVTYSSDGNPAFGVESIEIKPGITEVSRGTPVAPCFGSLADGCDFDPAESFQKAGISARLVCKEHPIIGLTHVGYEVSHPGKRTTLIRVDHNEGSAGRTSTVYLLFAVPREKLCPKTFD
jgi:hypothetical protein